MNEVRALHVSLADALAKGPPPAGNLAMPVFAHGTLEAELYAPVGEDKQQPHRRDEIYVVSRGTAVFVSGSSRETVETGAFIFVPAGRAHRFETFSRDFAVWVFFYGPESGSTESASAVPQSAAGPKGTRPLQTYRGSCHCGAVLFEIDTDFPELTTCDCSICKRKNALMVKVHESDLRVLAAEDTLATYQFHTGTAKHYFCRTCGIYPFHRKRSAPDHFGVNVYCLEDFDPSGIPVRATIGAAMP